MHASPIVIAPITVMGPASPADQSTPSYKASGRPRCSHQRLPMQNPPLRLPRTPPGSPRFDYLA